MANLFAMPSVLQWTSRPVWSGPFTARSRSCTRTSLAVSSRHPLSNIFLRITQCCIRHLYEHPKEPGLNQAIDLAKTFERRRCGHRPEDFDKALTSLECLKHVVDEKGRGENKHRYVVATQDQNVRRFMRGVSGVPLIYIVRMSRADHISRENGTEEEEEGQNTKLTGQTHRTGVS